MTHFEVRYLVNFNNGIWTGPHRITIGGRTLFSAWAGACTVMLTENKDITYFSLLGWRNTEARTTTDALTVVKSLRQIAHEHRKPPV